MGSAVATHVRGPGLSGGEGPGTVDGRTERGRDSHPLQRERNRENGYGPEQAGCLREGDEPVRV